MRHPFRMCFPLLALCLGAGLSCPLLTAQELVTPPAAISAAAASRDPAAVIEKAILEAPRALPVDAPSSSAPLTPTPPVVVVPAIPTEFFLAAASGDAAKLEEHLKAGVPVDGVVAQPVPPELMELVGPRTLGGLVLREGNATALMLAAAAGRQETMAALLAAGANRSARTVKGTRPLDLAAERGDVPGMKQLLGVKADSLADRLAITIDLSNQRAVVTRDGAEIFTTKISSGKKEKPTPPGTYVITQKYEMWRSTLYQNAAMPFFMRLSCSAVGLHQGNIPGYPASHGCVRLPGSAAKKLYAEVPLGTVVTIR